MDKLISDKNTELAKSVQILILMESVKKYNLSLNFGIIWKIQNFIYQEFMLMDSDEKIFLIVILNFADIFKKITWKWHIFQESR